MRAIWVGIKRWRISRLALYGILLVLAWLCPVNALRYRLILCAVAVLELALILRWIWPRRRLRCVAVGLLVAIAGLLLSPSRPTDTSTLRDRYVARLLAYEGVRYLWGGEGRLGIDCSGLPRRSLRDALWRRGLATWNGGLVREALRQWWYDASAKALAEGHRDYVVPLGNPGTIKEMDYGGLQPGDLAITVSGIHVLCYLGGDRWIQAEPDIRRVVVLNGRTDDNPWFDMPVKTYRWRMLERDNKDQARVEKAVGELERAGWSFSTESTESPEPPEFARLPERCRCTRPKFQR